MVLEQLNNYDASLHNWMKQLLADHNFDSIEIYSPDESPLTALQMVVTLKRGNLEFEIVAERNSQINCDGYLGASVVKDKFDQGKTMDIFEGEYNATSWFHLSEGIGKILGSNID